MLCPTARGPVSEGLLGALSGDPDEAVAILAPTVRDALTGTSDMLHEEDLQLSLFILYRLADRGLDGVDDAWEWHPDLLVVRSEIERSLVAELRARVPVPARPEPTAEAVAAALFELTAPGSEPGLSQFIAQKADIPQLREWLMHRSPYVLMEADPHTWAIPRLEGRPKAALVEIQSDEYGGGRPERMHAVLFASTMRGLGLDDVYGRYVDQLPAISLAWVNVASFFGLHRRWRGAICGHLAALEMTSSRPNRYYGDGFRRHRFTAEVTTYFDEHVEADAVHEQIAGRDLAGALVEQDPTLLDDVLFGAAVCLATDEWVADHLLSSWAEGRSSLRDVTYALV